MSLPTSFYEGNEYGLKIKNRMQVVFCYHIRTSYDEVNLLWLEMTLQFHLLSQSIFSLILNGIYPTQINCSGGFSQGKD